jgi:multicomponent Na+:H+ antiporter subunit D
MIESHYPALIPIMLFVGALMACVCRGGARTWPYAMAVIFPGISFTISLLGLIHVLGGEPMRYYFGGWLPPVGIELILDPLSAFFCLLLNGIALFVLWHGREVVSFETPGKEIPFYSAVLLLLGGLCGIVLTGDLFNLYVFLEISSLATYALLSIGDRRAPVAGFRYLILGTVGASFYLLGVGLFFMVAGSLNMADLAEIIPVIGHSPATLGGLALIVLGIGLKMAMFPMHGWLADAYTYASSTSSALVAAIGTKVAAYVLIRVLFFMEDPAFVVNEIPLATMILYLGAAGVFWGSAMAMAQKDLKRMLAFSSVGHIGYIAIGIGLGSPLGLVAALLHSLNHAVMKACLFLICGTLLLKEGHTSIDKLHNGLRRSMPWTMLAFVIAAVSMIGLPPTAGFFSKWYLVMGTLEQDRWVLVAVIVISSLFSVVYFFRVLEKIYLRPAGAKEIPEAEEPKPPLAEPSFSMLAPVLIMSVGLLVLGLTNYLIVQHVIVPMLPAGWNL